MVQSAQDQQIAYILRSYPRLSQTFILNEILALEQLGLGIRIFAITDPHEPIVQAQTAEVRAPVSYLETARKRSRGNVLREHVEWMTRAPARYLRAVWTALRSEDPGGGYAATSRLDCFLQAVYLAGLLRREAAGIHVHAHFAHDPTLIALLVNMLTGIPYSFTAHARDLYQVPEPALAERVGRASAVVTCCDANVQHFYSVLPASLHRKVHLVRHGVNLEGFQPVARAKEPSHTPVILSVGRLVEKKGFRDLIEACRLLRDRGCRFRCEIYGEGPLRSELEAFIREHDLADWVVLAGARTQEQLVAVYQAADIFVLTPFVTEDGDRDGIPNVLAEAMACGLPVVTTSVAGIPELVVHGENGLMFEPHDVQAIAAGIGELLDDEPRRKQLGAFGRRVVSDRFDARAAAGRLAALFHTEVEQHRQEHSVRSGWGQTFRRRRRASIGHVLGSGK